MTIRQLAALVLTALVVFGPASAQTVELRADHPDRYVVQRGDTLWDISSRFLTKPWLWPEVWEANPQIDNPHLIYPGDELSLFYVDGQPRISVRRGRRGGTIKLGPKVRVETLDAAIPTIRVEAIQQFLSRPRVVSEAEFDSAPYIVAVGREALLGRPGEPVFARGLDGAHKRYAVYRRGQRYVNPQDVVIPTNYGVRVNRTAIRSPEVLGIEAVHVADAIVEAQGDPSTLLLTSAKRELRRGDRLVPVTEEEPYQHFYPRAVPDGFGGQIIAVLDGVTQIGELMVVVLNRGLRDGIEVGHVMGVYQRGEPQVDPWAVEPPPARAYADQIQLDPQLQGGPDGWGVSANDGMDDLTRRFSRFFSRIAGVPQPWQIVNLPDRRAGTVMVFRPFERVSYALVVEATGAMHVTDYVAAP